MRFDSLQLQLPPQVLAIHLAHVGNEKSIIFSGFADVCIDPFHSPPQSFHGQNPANFRTVVHVAEPIMIWVLFLPRLRLCLNFCRAIT